MIYFLRCQSCSLGEYSFEDGMDAKRCQKCPTEAEECYLDKIFLFKGKGVLR